MTLAAGFSPFFLVFDWRRRQTIASLFVHLDFRRSTGSAHALRQMSLASRRANDTGHMLTQTTPHLFGWLMFTGRLVNQTSRP